MLRAKIKTKMGYSTVKDGEQALILNNRGRARLVEGPQRVKKYRSAIE